jgi:hypothetical protein
MATETVQQKCLRLRRESFARDFIRLEQDLAAVEEDLDTVQEAVRKRRLQEQKRQLLADIDRLSEEQEEFEQLNSVTPWKGNLYKINHKESKEKTSDILRQFRTNPGSSLFLFQQSEDFLGNRYVEYLINLINSDDTDIGHFSQPYQIGLTESNPRPIDFLWEFAHTLTVEKSDSQDLLVDLILDKIKVILSSCNVFFIQVNLLKIGQHCEFISWFLDTFWKKLIDRMPDDAVFIGVVTLESPLKEEFIQDCLYNASTLEQRRVVVLPQEEWERRDLQPWMSKYSGHRTILPDKLETLLRNVLEYQKGIPSRAERQLTRELDELDELKRRMS